jgi:dienelactone hydrolase
MRLSIFISSFLLISCFIETTAQKDSIPDSKYSPPIGVSKDIAIVFLGGSDGGLPYYFDTDHYTSLGYPCLLLGYFGTINTPNTLELIPLEYFVESINKFKSLPDIKNKKIVLCGNSKGGELVLLLASLFKNIDGVIAIVPSSVVFQGIAGNKVSSWSYKGEPIPFVPYVPYDWSKIVDYHFGEVHELSLQQSEAVNIAAIQVENIKCPILLLAGKDDLLWPSHKMCEMIIKRLDNHNFPFSYNYFSYDNAGHTLNEQFLFGGGTFDGNQHARIDSKQRILDFLNNLSSQ